MRRFFITLMLAASLAAGADLPSCRSVATALLGQLGEPGDAQQLGQIISTLNKTGDLPDDFVTKREARAAGWTPGRPMWGITALRGKSIGGDRFGNHEGLLPTGNWREADLGYAGGKRNAKRLVYEPGKNGRRYVTLDHYQHFTEAPPCR
ncbi:ribonuclease domain-containing protein [Chitinimonas sp.]|uniref:ribonuclease domain-containing protein n=1 Tax=Chitinimonas sp. TaxID=1934313 RepID=UPI0035B3730E